MSAHSPASFVGGRADRFPFRLVSRLACSSCGASRDYSLRFACQSVSSRRFAGVSLFRLARRSVSCSSVLLVVPRCLVLPGLSFPLVSHGVLSSSPCSRFVWRLVGRSGFSLFVLSVLVSSCSLPFHGHGEGRRLVLLLPCGCVFLSLLPSVIVVERGDGGNGRAVRRYGGTRRFIQLVFPIRAGMK